MPCILAVLALLFPRVVILLLYFFTNFFHGLFDTVLIPVLGFIFLPLTLLAYAWLRHSGQPVGSLLFLVVMSLAVVIDLGLLGGGKHWRRSRP